MKVIFLDQRGPSGDDSNVFHGSMLIFNVLYSSRLIFFKNLVLAKIDITLFQGKMFNEAWEFIEGSAWAYATGSDWSISGYH